MSANASPPSIRQKTGGDFSIKPFSMTVFREFTSDNGTRLAQAVAYNLVFALPPTVTLIVTLAALLNKYTGIPVESTLSDAIANNAPGQAQDVLNTILNNTIQDVSGGAITIGLIVSLLLALYGASGGIESLMDAFNVAYDVNDTRGFIGKKLVAVALALTIGVLIVAAFALFVFGNQIGTWIAGWVGLGSVFTTVWNILRWPVAAIVVLLALQLLYYYGTDVKQKFRWASPGAILAATLWVIAIFGVKLYLTVSDPGSAYGAAGGLIVLLFFLYITGIVFIIGAEVNGVLEHRRDPATIRDLSAHPGKVADPVTYEQEWRRARGLEQAQSGDTTTPSDLRPPKRVTKRRSMPEPGPKGLAGTLGSLGAAFILDRVRGKKGKSKS